MPSEQEVDITEYVSSAAAVQGILRHRITDFKVNEIDSRMRVARLMLEDLDAPKRVPEISSFDNEPAIRACVSSFGELAGGEKAENLRRFLHVLRDRVRFIAYTCRCVH
jgi:hypothetical protein